MTQVIKHDGVAYRVDWDYADDQGGSVTVPGLTTCPSCKKNDMRWDFETAWPRQSAEPITHVLCRDCGAEWRVEIIKAESCRG